jgi:hypothetical protein
MESMSNSPNPCVVEGYTWLNPFGWVEALLALEVAPSTIFDGVRDSRRVTIIASGNTITVRHGRNGSGDILVVVPNDSAAIRFSRVGSKPALRISLQRRTIQHPSGTLRIRLRPADIAMLQQVLASGQSAQG